MNYLAHACLSFNIPGVLTGNMISDFVKGKKQFNYPLPVQKGIQLHRQIDAFTDSHIVTHQMKQFFKPHYRLYAGAFCDVVHDHFLANDINEFKTEGALLHFSEFVYEKLYQDEELLPDMFKKMLPYMKNQNWLYNYRTAWGMQKSFGGLVRRSKYLTESESAFEVFNENYAVFQQLYNQFYPELKTFAAHQLQQLLNA
jgi:acyl carrier protein phosphodiesterase